MAWFTFNPASSRRMASQDRGLSARLGGDLEELQATRYRCWVKGSSRMLTPRNAWLTTAAGPPTCRFAVVTQEIKRVPQTLENGLIFLLEESPHCKYFQR